MSWIARAQLASAVCNAGGMGIIETGSGEFDAIRSEVLKMRELTDKPFGMNVALAFVKGSDFIDFVIGQNLPFVTTSSGSPAVCTEVSFSRQVSRCFMWCPPWIWRSRRSTAVWMA